MNKIPDIIPKDCDFTIHDAVDDLFSTLRTYAITNEILPFIADELSEKIYQIKNLLYLHKVSCAIPCYKVLETLSINYCDEGDYD